MFCIDPTEADSNTRLPQDVVARATLLPGLEEHTGADLLISPLEELAIGKLTGIGLSKAKLQTHLEAGAMLVQRKSGRDMINFIMDHDQIIAKMLLWTAEPWLLYTGNFNYNSDGDLLIESKPIGRTDKHWSWFSFLGSLRSWQKAGGLVTDLPYDQAITAWVAYMYSKLCDELKHPRDEKAISGRKPSTRITVVDSGSSLENRQKAFCINMLSAIPGIGVTKAVEVTRYCGTFKAALDFLSDPASLSMKDTHDLFPEGIGPVTIATLRQLSGLDSGGTDDDQWLEVFTTTTVKPTAKKRKAKAETKVDDPPWNP